MVDVCAFIVGLQYQAAGAGRVRSGDDALGGCASAPARRTLVVGGLARLQGRVGLAVGLPASPHRVTAPGQGMPSRPAPTARRPRSATASPPPPALPVEPRPDRPVPRLGA